MQSLKSLINRLSKSEKRFFRLYASRNKKASQYLQLFDQLDKNKEDCQNRANPSVTKRYLYELLLRSLREYHHQNSIDIKLNNLFSEIEILYNKELLVDCLQSISKAEKLAKTFGKLSRLMDVFMWRRKLLLTQFQSYEINCELNDLLIQEKSLIQDFQNTHEYWRIIVNIFEHNSSNDETFLKQTLLETPDHASTMRAKALYFNILFSNYMIQNKPKLALQAIDQLIDLLELNEKFIEDDPSLYLTTLNNKIAIIDHGSENYRAITKHVIDQGLYYSKRGNMGATKQLLRSYNNYLVYLRENGETKEGIKLVDQINQYLIKHKKQIPEEYYISLYYQFAYLYYCLANYNESLYWLGIIKKEISSDMRQDLQSYARFLTLINHFELRHYSILRFGVEAYRRFLKKKRDILPFEILLLRFFSKISEAPEIHFKNHFGKLKLDLTPLLQHSELVYFDFQKWIKKHC